MPPSPIYALIVITTAILSLGCQGAPGPPGECEAPPTVEQVARAIIALPEFKDILKPDTTSTVATTESASVDSSVAKRLNALAACLSTLTIASSASKAIRKCGRLGMRPQE